jgi:hypothetical protein
LPIEQPQPGGQAGRSGIVRRELPDA